MPTQSKVKTYLLIVPLVETALENATGVASIDDLIHATVEVDPAALPPPSLTSAWLITVVGPQVNQQYYETQTYRVTATEVANFVNNHAGTSFTAINIVSVTHGRDPSYFEVTTT